MNRTIVLLSLTVSIFFASMAGANTLVLATGEWAPFIGAKEPGNGLHSKIISKIAAKMGYEVQFDYMNWKRAYELTKKGDYIASFTWSDTPARRGEVLYPVNELALSKEVGFYKKSKFPEGLNVKSLEDIKSQGLEPVGIASYWYEKVYKEVGIKAHTVADANVAWKFLDKGRADILVENIDVGKAAINSLLGAGKDAEFGMTEPVKSQKMYLVFSKNHPDSEAVIKLYDKAVEELKAAGEL